MLFPGSVVASVVWRPLVFRAALLAAALPGAGALGHFPYAGAQCLDLLLLPEDHVAELGIGALQECQLQVDLLEGLIVHGEQFSVTRWRRRNPARNQHRGARRLLRSRSGHSLRCFGHRRGCRA
jgi:hypothetical protein